MDQDNVRINERIRIRQVRLIDQNGEQKGVVDTYEAQRMAKEVGLDLVEVSPNDRPPVCRIMNFGKYKYEKKKNQKHHKPPQLREIRLGLRIQEHDYAVKLRKIIEFLQDKDRVQIVLMFQGREIVHKEQGQEMIDKIIADTSSAGKVERMPIWEGKKLILLLAPK